ncbi:Heat shock protein Hsp20 domain protein [mine drainage metagenome]|uniref:Heat shock protein Hsp20 domain protein n=1 Tax=mine drainage metagenome TaxID=410659 RepID=T1BA73_9ZZZZ
MINVGETDQEFKVYVFAPGMDQKDLEVRIQNNLLTIQGKRETLTEKDLKEATVYRQERFSGEFVKTLSLPDSVNSESIEARVKNGIVTITLPKKAALQPKRIEVRAA